jgi:hypothetical protein
MNGVIFEESMVLRAIHEYDERHKENYEDLV